MHMVSPCLWVNRQILYSSQPFTQLFCLDAVRGRADPEIVGGRRCDLRLVRAPSGVRLSSFELPDSQFRLQSPTWTFWICENVIRPATLRILPSEIRLRSSWNYSGSKCASTWCDVLTPSGWVCPVGIYRLYVPVPRRWGVVRRREAAWITDNATATDIRHHACPVGHQSLTIACLPASGQPSVTTVI